MKVVIGSHSSVSIGNGHNYPYLWTSKTFTIAIDIRGFLTVGSPFTARHMEKLWICKRFSDSHLSSLFIRELARMSLDLQDFRDMPKKVYTDTGYEIQAVFLEWSEEASVYLLNAVVEGKIVAVKTEGVRCQLHGKGRIDTCLLFCIPFYCLTSRESVVSVDVPVEHSKALCELINGNVRNHNYLHSNPDVFFSFVVHERSPREVIGNKSLITELTWLNWMAYVK